MSIPLLAQRLIALAAAASLAACLKPGKRAMD